MCVEQFKTCIVVDKSSIKKRRQLDAGCRGRHVRGQGPFPELRRKSAVAALLICMGIGRIVVNVVNRGCS